MKITFLSKDVKATLFGYSQTTMPPKFNDFPIPRQLYSTVKL